MDGNTPAGKCPVFHGAAAAGGTTNKDWWPNLLNLSVLHQHSPKSNPMGADFNYAEEFKKLDLKAVKQDLQWLQQLCPYPDDDEERRLLDVALAGPARKVVIKRARRAPPLAGRAPHHVLEGKTVSFDVHHGMAVNN